MRTFFGFVGLAMFLGFGALGVDQVLDLRAYPAEPRPLTVAEAAALEEPGRGAWVRLTDVRFPCAQAAQRGSDVYRLGFGATERERVIASAVTLPCSDAPTTLVGVLRAVPAGGGLTGLAFPGYPFERWPRRWQTELQAGGGPKESWGFVVMLAPFTLIGLIIAAAYWKPQHAVHVAGVEPVPSAEGLAPWRSEERVLPQRPLELASSSLYDRVLTVAALLDFAAILGWLAWACVPKNGWLGWVGVAVFGALAALLLAGLVRIGWSWVRERAPGAERFEALVPLLEHTVALANGVDVGNREYVYADPVTGARASATVGFQEAPPLVVNGRLFVVHGGARTPVVLVRAGFAPFALSKDERREALLRLARFDAFVPRR